MTVSLLSFGFAMAIAAPTPGAECVVEPLPMAANDESGAEAAENRSRGEVETPIVRRGKLRLIVDPQTAAKLLRGGQATTSCAPTVAEIDAYKSEICAMAAFGNVAVQNRFASVLGAPPNDLCEAAKTLVLQSTKAP